MKRMYVRVFTILLALLCALPCASFFAFADSDVSVGAEYAAVPAYGTLKEEAVGDTEETIRFVRIPYVGSYTPASGTTQAVMTGNCNRFLQIKHAELKNKGAYIIEVAYRPHTNRTGNTVAEALFDRFTVTTASGGRQEDAGRDLVFYKINLNDGSLDLGVGAKLVSGAAGMTLDKWNTVQVVFYNANANYEVYVNGALYGYQYNPKLTVSSEKGEHAYFNCTDVTVGADRFIPVRCTRLSSYTEKDLGDETNYIDVRDVKITETQDVSVTLDGKTRHFAKSLGLPLIDGSKTLLYAEVKNPNKPIYYTSETILTDLEDGAVINTRFMDMKSVENAHSMRTEAPYGLRFLTAISKSDYEQLKADGLVKRIKFGTVIFQKEKMKADVLNVETLSELQHLDVALDGEDWYEDYEVNFSHVFAGAIVNLKEQNYDTPFAGIGYVKLVMRDGSVVTSFAESKKGNIGSKTLALAAHEALMKYPDLDAKTTAELKKYAAKAAIDLQGLNVLAMGDSLFSGSKGTDGPKQWINLLGNRFGWNLTNLGIGGASISYQPDRLIDEKPIRNASIYNLLFNHNSSYRYGSRANSVYYNCGAPSGKAADVDIIILQAGSNDYGPKVQAPIGTVGSTEPNTFLGAWKLVVDRLLVEYPNATVVMMTAWENSNQGREDGANAIEYTSSVVTLYNELYKGHDRVRLIDAGSPAVSGVDMRNSEFRSKYAHDSFHLNDDGMILMANSMIPYLEEIALERKMLKETTLRGIDVLAIGDSLFGGHSLPAGKQWLELLATQYDWNLTNLGVNGWTVAYNPGAYADQSKVRTSMYDKLMNDSKFKFGTKESMYYSYGNPSGNAEDVDLIFLEGGWNDYGHGLPLGTATDTGGSTYMGAVNSMVAKLLETYPNARVVLITSWHTSGVRADGAKRMDFVADGMKAVVAANYADNDRVALIDAGNPTVTGVLMGNEEWASEYAMDAAHLNEKGMAFMAEKMPNLIWRLIP